MNTTYKNIYRLGILKWIFLSSFLTLFLLNIFSIKFVCNNILFFNIFSNVYGYVSIIVLFIYFAKVNISVRGFDKTIKSIHVPIIAFLGYSCIGLPVNYMRIIQSGIDSGEFIWPLLHTSYYYTTINESLGLGFVTIPLLFFNFRYTLYYGSLLISTKIVHYVFLSSISSYPIFFIGSIRSQEISFMNFLGNIYIGTVFSSLLFILILFIQKNRSSLSSNFVDFFYCILIAFFPTIIVLANEGLEFGGNLNPLLLLTLLFVQALIVRFSLQMRNIFFSKPKQDKNLIIEYFYSSKIMLHSSVASSLIIELGLVRKLVLIVAANIVFFLLGVLLCNYFLMAYLIYAKIIWILNTFILLIFLILERKTARQYFNLVSPTKLSIFYIGIYCVLGITGLTLNSRFLSNEKVMNIFIHNKFKDNKAVEIASDLGSLLLIDSKLSLSSYDFYNSSPEDSLNYSNEKFMKMSNVNITDTISSASLVEMKNKILNKYGIEFPTNSKPSKGTSSDEDLYNYLRLFYIDFEKTSLRAENNSRLSILDALGITSILFVFSMSFWFIKEYYQALIYATVLLMTGYFFENYLSYQFLFLTSFAVLGISFFTNSRDTITLVYSIFGFFWVVSFYNSVGLYFSSVSTLGLIIIELLSWSSICVFLNIMLLNNLKPSN